VCDTDFTHCETLEAFVAIVSTVSNVPYWIHGNRLLVQFTTCITKKESGRRQTVVGQLDYQCVNHNPKDPQSCNQLLE